MWHNYNTWLSMQKPIVPTEFYRAVRDSQLIGMSGYSKEVLVCYTIIYFVADRTVVALNRMFPHSDLDITE